MDIFNPRDGFGRFRRLRCVNAHDRCDGAPCQLCEFAPVRAKPAPGISDAQERVS